MLAISFKYLLTLSLSIFKRSPKQSMAEVLKSSCLRNESIWVGFATNEIHWRVMGILLGSPNSSHLVFYSHSNELPQTWQLKQHAFTVFQFWRSDVWYGLASGCWQGCVPFWASREQSISFPFPVSRQYPPFLACGSFHHPQNQHLGLSPSHLSISLTLSFSFKETHDYLDNLLNPPGQSP